MRSSGYLQSLDQVRKVVIVTPRKFLPIAFLLMSIGTFIIVNVSEAMPDDINTSASGMLYTAQHDGAMRAACDVVGQDTKVFFLRDHKTGWALEWRFECRGTQCGSTHLLKTIDGGCHWESIWKQKDLTFRDLFFVDNRIGWLLDQIGYVYRTQDGGNTWAVAGHVFKSVSFYFLDSKVGWLLEDGAPANGIPIWRTIDGGATWNTLSHDQVLNGLGLGLARYERDVRWKEGRKFLQAVRDHPHWKFPPSGSRLTIFKTTVQPSYGRAFGLYARYVDESTAWIANFRTVNGGQTWEEMSPLGFYTGDSPYFVDKLRGWLNESVGGYSRPRILQSDDGGHIWRQIFEGFEAMEGATLRNVHFFDDENGWMYVESRGRYRGWLMRTYDHGATWQPCAKMKRQFLMETVFDGRLGLSVRRHLDQESKYVLEGVVRSRDMGCTWERVWIPPSEGGQVVGLSILGVGKAVFSHHRQGERVGIYQTRNDGLTWTVGELSKLPGLEQCVRGLCDNLHFFSQDLGWAFVPISQESKPWLLRTTDSGRTWYTVPKSEIENYFGLSKKDYETKFKWNRGKLLRMLLKHTPDSELPAMAFGPPRKYEPPEK